MNQVAAAPQGRWRRRYTMITLLLLALLLCYIDRVLMSLAAIEMQREFGWSDSQKGLVLSTFFVGYLITQATGGIFSNRFGGRNVFLIAVLLWSLFTLLTPFSAYVSFGALIFVRIMLGFGEGAAFPSAYNLIHQWMPVKERSQSVGGMGAASSIGTVLTLLTAGLIIARFGWPSVFYLFGAMGFVWATFWLLKVPAQPSPDDDESDHGVNTKRSPIPWRILATHRAIYAIYIASICVGSISFTLASWLPSYFVDSFDMGLTQAGLYSTVPWIALGIAGVVGGVYSDRQIASGVERIRVRKKVTTFGLSLIIVSCLALVTMSSAATAVAVICFLFVGQGIAVVGYAPTAAELLPEHGDVFYGIAAAAGSLGAMVIVSGTGVLVEQTDSYNGLFLAMAVMAAFVIVTYQWLGRTDPLTPPPARDAGLEIG